MVPGIPIRTTLFHTVRLPLRRVRPAYFSTPIASGWFGHFHRIAMGATGRNNGAAGDRIPGGIIHSICVSAIQPSQAVADDKTVDGSIVYSSVRFPKRIDDLEAGEIPFVVCDDDTFVRVGDRHDDHGESAFWPSRRGSVGHQLCPSKYSTLPVEGKHAPREERLRSLRADEP